MSMITKTLILSLSTLGALTALAGEQPAAPPVPSAAPAPIPAAPGTNAVGPAPKIQFATTVGEFGKVVKGEAVKYTYYFTNTGDKLLELSNVQPGCGCTTAGEWTKKVEPGQSGAIPIQFNSGNFKGAVTKFVTVTCNDPKTPSTMLQLKGTIWEPLEVNPTFVNLSITPDNPRASSVVTITNNVETPLYVSLPQCSNKSFNTELKTNALGKGYQLVISTEPPFPPGIVQGEITLKTSWTNPAEIKVKAWAQVQPAVTVLPMSLLVPQPPLTTTQTMTVTIIHNSTNHLTLSEPAINSPDVQVSIKEQQPGHYFNAYLTFPPGFELAQGKQLEFTVKSSNEKTPIIKVPVTQVPRPATPPTPAIAPPNPLAGGQPSHLLPPLPDADHKLPAPPARTPTQ
jgi:hypothetical protein